MSPSEKLLVHESEAFHERLALLTRENHRLNVELPKMRRENKRLTDFIQNAAAYLRVTAVDGAIVQLSTLRHDINGIASDEPCFLPKVSGYAKAEQETK